MIVISGRGTENDRVMGRWACRERLRRNSDQDAPGAHAPVAHRAQSHVHMTLRPVLIAFLIAADDFVVAALAIVRPPGWGAPLAAFDLALAGLIGLEAWALAHRRDDDRRRGRANGSGR